jgi:hypothetical protein
MTMAWSNIRKVGLAELLTKLAKLHSKIVELKVRQQCDRAKQQGVMLQASRQAPQEKPK